MKDVLLEKIVEGHKNFLQFQELVNQKRAQIDESKKTLKVEDETNVDNIIKHYTDVYVDLVLFSRDMQIGFAKVFFELDLFKELGYEGLPDQIEEFYNKNKPFAPTQMFVIKENKVLEKETGALAKARQDFLDNNPFIQQLKAKDV